MAVSFTNEQWAEFMSHQEQKETVLVQLIQDNAKKQIEAAEKRHEEEIEKREEDMKLAEARHKTEREQLLSKFGEIFIVENGEEDASGVGQRLLNNYAKFVQLQTQFRKLTVRKYSPREQNVNAWLQTVFHAVAM